MPESTEYDPTDRGTLRPNAKPLQKAGDHFEPMVLPDWGWNINLPENASPDDPISLFSIYYTPEIIDMIVEKTNEHTRQPADDSCPRARANDWYPTSRGEIYLYFAIRIYMTLHIDNEIADYWNTKDFTPNYCISSFMSRDRFQELHMRFRLAGPEAKGPYEKVSVFAPHFCFFFKCLLIILK
jgi:hypothetical protein